VTEHAPHNALSDPDDVARFHDRCSDLMRELGRDGLEELVDRCCALATRFAERLSDHDGVVIGNQVVLNQVLVSFGDDDRTDAVIDAIQREGTCWMGGTTWRGRRYMRISVSNWSTTEADVDRSADAIARCAATASGGSASSSASSPR